MTPRLRLSDPLLRVQSDERLAALAGHGGERAFAILVERHRGPLLAFARRLGAGAGAEDVVQQALLQAWSALQRGARVQHVSAWMHRIVRNAAIRAAAASLDSAELPATLVAPSRTAEEVELRHETRRLLAEIERLPIRQREALVRLAVAGSSGDEAGAAMDLEPNAVRQLAFRARTRLRAAMGACVPWPLALWAARGGGSLAAGAGGTPELLGGAGLASGAGAAGLLKVGAIATTTVAVAVGAGGLVHRDPHRPAAAARSHVAAAGSASALGGAAAPVVWGTGPTDRVERSAGLPHGRGGDGRSGGDGGARRDKGDDGSAHEPEHGESTPAAAGPVQRETEHAGGEGGSAGGTAGGDDAATAIADDGASGSGSGSGGDRYTGDGPGDGSGGSSGGSGSAGDDGGSSSGSGEPTPTSGDPAGGG